MEVATLLFSFYGRINRAKYWLAALVYTVINLVLVLIEQVWGEGPGYETLSFFVNVAVFISGLAVSTKRLHDRDKSAWWLLLFYFLPAALLMWIFFDIVNGANVRLRYAALFLALMVIWIWLIVELGCLRGTVGANEYGPDPLGKA